LKHHPGPNQNRPRKGPMMANSKRICSVDGCGKASQTRGLCGSHYHRLKRYGDPEGKPPIKVPLSCLVDGCDSVSRKCGYCIRHYERNFRHGSPNGGGIGHGDALRFLREHVSFTGAECLTWPYAKNSKGYGIVGGGAPSRIASRAMCIMVHGKPQTKKHQAAHTCGKGHEACVNPAHLYWAMPSVNQMDRVKHGTDNRGEKHPLVKLSRDEVRQIRSACGTHREISKQFGTSRENVGSIKRGKTWEWLK